MKKTKEDHALQQYGYLAKQSGKKDLIVICLASDFMLLLLPLLCYLARGNLFADIFAKPQCIKR